MKRENAKQGGNGGANSPDLDTTAPSLEESAPELVPAAESTAMTAPQPTAEEKRLARQSQAADETREAEQALSTLGEVGDSGLMPFSPSTFEAAWKLAWHLSQSGIVSDGLKRNAGAVLSVMARGAYLGIPWAIAVQEAHVVNGKVGWPASLLAAICDTSPTFEYFEVVEADNESATVEAKKPRWKEPKTYTFTIQHARDMGFMDGKHSKLWKSKRPMPMLIAAARREAARLWDPARCAGIYTPDELEATRVARQLPEERPTSRTAALAERISAQAPVVEVESTAAQPSAETVEALPEPPTSDDGRPMLDDRQMETICETLARDPEVELSALEEHWGDPLADLAGEEGQSNAAFYTEVLGTIKELKKRTMRR